MTIKNRLKVILAEKRISQNELAEQLEINRSTLSNIISSKQNCTLETALDIAKVLNVSVEDIFYKEIDRNEDVYEEFKKIVIQMNCIYTLYENNTFSRSDLINIFKNIISIYQKKYEVYAIDVYADEYLQENGEINSISMSYIIK